MPLDWESLWYGPDTWLTRLVRWLLAPVALVYAALTRGWHALYDLGLRRPVRVRGVRVISVGNIVVGGAGKTPVVIWVARRAQQAGLKVAVLSRGYGRVARDLRHFDASSLPPVEEVGDEPRLIARSCPGVTLWVGADRVASAQAAASDGAQLLILDDGFQHRRLHRDVDLVVNVGVGNGWPLPAGPLREGRAALRRASVLWGRDGWAGTVHAKHVVRRVRQPSGAIVDATALRGRRVVVLTAIARPARLIGTLEALGTVIESVRAYGDHHRFTQEECLWARAAADRAGALLVMTEKDAEKADIHAWVLLQEIELSDASLPESLNFSVNPDSD